MGITDEDLVAQTTYNILSKDIDASGLTTAQRQKLSARINRRAFFSANITNENLLSDMRDFIARSVSGDANFSKEAFVKKSEEFLSKYDLTLDEAEAVGDLNRLRLIYETQTAMAQGEADYEMFTDPDLADDFPCQELVRVEWRKEPRNWIEIWSEAGGNFYEGFRMIAPRNDDIWLRISDFGNPYPPFKYNSGMGVVPVMRDEAVELGVIPKWYTAEPNKPLDEIEDWEDYDA